MGAICVINLRGVEALTGSRTDRFNDEHVTLPATDRVPGVGRIRILR